MSFEVPIDCASSTMGGRMLDPRPGMRRRRGGKPNTADPSTSTATTVVRGHVSCTRCDSPAMVAPVPTPTNR